MDRLIDWVFAVTIVLFGIAGSALAVWVFASIIYALTGALHNG